VPSPSEIQNKYFLLALKKKKRNCSLCQKGTSQSKLQIKCCFGDFACLVFTILSKSNMEKYEYSYEKQIKQIQSGWTAHDCYRMVMRM
jgi:hypothetical protein